MYYSEFLDTTDNNVLKAKFTMEAEEISILADGLRFYYFMHSDWLNEHAPSFRDKAAKVIEVSNRGNSASITWELQSPAPALGHYAGALVGYGNDLARFQAVLMPPRDHGSKNIDWRRLLRIREESSNDQFDFTALESKRIIVSRMAGDFARFARVNSLAAKPNGEQDY